MSKNRGSQKGRQLKIAIVHDYLYWYGGAEKVVEALHEIWPEAPIYTSYYSPEDMPDKMREWDIRQTFIQRLPCKGKLFRHYYIFYHHAFNRLDFSDYDLVISSSAGFAKDILIPGKTAHVAYTHTIPRYLWDLETSLHNKLNPLYRAILPPIEAWFKRNDIKAAQRVDHFVANSLAVERRISKAYRRKSTVINPPVETQEIIEHCQNHKPENGSFFLTTGRLQEYKRYDIAIKACNELKLPLKIIGDGDHRRELEEMAGPTVEFLGFIRKPEKFKHLCNCKALIYPNREDFGIVAVEAMAAGKPVIGLGRDGLLETVQEGVTGEFFHDANGSDLHDLLAKFDASKYNPEACRGRARQFSKQVFKNNIKQFVKGKCSTQ